LPETRIKFRGDKGIRSPEKPRRPRLSFLGSWIVFLFIASLTTVLISKVFFFKPYGFEVGTIMGKTIRAPFPFEVEDRDAYNKDLEDLLKKNPRCYVYDSSVEQKIIQTIEGIQEDVVDILSNELDKEETLRKKMKRKFGLSLSDDITTTLLQLGNDKKFYDNLRYLVHDIMTNRGVLDEKYIFQTYEKQGQVKISSSLYQPPNNFVGANLIKYPEEIPAILNRSLSVYFAGVQVSHLSAARELAATLIEPNLKFDPELTDQERKKMISKVKKIKYTFGRGDIIIGATEKIDSFHANALSRLNECILNAHLMQLLANFLLVLIIFGFVAFFVHKYRPDLGFTPSNIVLISLPGLLALGLGRFLIQSLGQEKLFAGYAFPAGLIGILAVVLLDARIGFLLVSWGAFLCGIQMDMNFKTALFAFIGGVTGVLSLYNVRERKEMLMAGFRIAFVNFICIILFEYIDDPTRQFHTYAQIAVWGVGNGFACAIIAFPALKFFEMFFNVVTDVRLLELTGIRQSLLSDMEEKAPGSYQHSLNVAKLAEPAAIAVGVNYFLVRAGAYYHDIGKMIKPKYYSENQTTPEDKKMYHNITPHMAVLIIKQHIKEGIELARKTGLPQSVIDFIPQHHGTSLIRYFYNQALQRHKEDKSDDIIREEDFRYPGPKPQTIETAIVMLADCVEATITSELSQAFLDQDDIRLIVHNSILTQFNDGQFDECNMTLRDLHIIEESFIQTLLSRYHYRVEYPGKRKSVELEEIRQEMGNSKEHG